MAYRFLDRAAAGRALAGKLGAYARRPDLLVLALPRGGVPVAFEIARALRAPLDVLVVRKLGVPGHSELAMGAIASGGVLVVNREVVRDLRISRATIERIADQERPELQRRERAYRGGRPALDIAGRTVILVDDGLATGSSMQAAVTALRERGPARVVVAVPVVALESCEEIHAAVDEIVWALAPDPFHAVGMWYVDFRPTTDQEVRDLLSQSYGKEACAMPAVSANLRSFLDQHQVTYEIIHHRRDYTAMETAADTHTPGREFAKTVLVWFDGTYAMVVLPAHHQIDFRKLRKALGATIVRLADEEEYSEICPDCEVGTAPPFGNLYDLPVYVSAALSASEQISFNGGTHGDVVRISYSDWQRLARPHAADISLSI